MSANNLDMINRLRYIAQNGVNATQRDLARKAADATERLAENEHVIASQKEHIEMLEFHLGKCRDSAYQMYYATVGVLPENYAKRNEDAALREYGPDGKQKKAKVKK
jgi:hypothetical protein